MRAIGDLLFVLGVLAVLASCTLGVAVGSAGSWGFGMIIIGLLMKIAGRKSPHDPEAPTPETHVRCPDCRELVRMDATKCRHCQAALIPTQPDRSSPSMFNNLPAIAVAVLVLMVVLEWLRNKL